MHFSSIILLRFEGQFVRQFRAGLGGKSCAPGGQILSWGGKQVGELELNPEDQLEAGKENATGADQGGNGKKIVRHFGETQKRAAAGRKNSWAAKCEKNFQCPEARIHSSLQY